MCKASNLLNEFKRMTKEVESEQKRLYGIPSQYDQEISRVYHKLEVSIFNKRQGDNYARKLQRIYKKRRIIKNEIDYYKSMSRTIDLGSFYNSTIQASKNVDKLQRKHKAYSGSWGITIDEIELEYIQQ